MFSTCRAYGWRSVVLVIYTAFGTRRWFPSLWFPLFCWLRQLKAAPQWLIFTSTIINISIVLLSPTPHLPLCLSHAGSFGKHSLARARAHTHTHTHTHKTHTLTLTLTLTHTNTNTHTRAKSLFYSGISWIREILKFIILSTILLNWIKCL